MILRLSKENEIERLTEISVAAFNTDYLVGCEPNDGPPDYDSIKWHQDMQKKGCLFAYEKDGDVIGGAVLFKKNNVLYIGRIFIDPKYFRQGLGYSLMKDIEKLYEEVNFYRLDTPIFNIRTNALYQKLGYFETGRNIDTVFYQKIK